MGTRLLACLSLVLFPLAVSAQEPRLVVQGAHSDGVTAVAFSADGRRIAVAGFDGTLRLLDSANGQETLTIYAHTSPVAGVAFSPDPDGFRLASASYDHTVRIWDATPLTRDPQAGHCVTLTAHQQQVSGVAFSRDGRWLASASFDHTVKVWEPVRRICNPSPIPRTDCQSVLRH